MRTTGRDLNYRHFIPRELINDRLRSDASGFIAECENDYRDDISSAAGFIVSRLHESNIVMLTGPSASGKTTTAHKLSQALESLSVKAHTVSMDNYFLSHDEVSPKLDFETPLRLDIPLLQKHIRDISLHRPVWIPRYDFLSATKTDSVFEIRPSSDEVVIFEGIHALNELFIPNTPSRPSGIYMSPRLRVIHGDRIVISPEELRFLRRGIRDSRTRGAGFSRTLELWPDVISGETSYIKPTKRRADIVIDTSLEYEPAVLAVFAAGALSNLDKESLSALSMDKIAFELEQFSTVDPSLVPQNSMLREFIGPK